MNEVKIPELKLDPNGLIVAVVQDYKSKDVLMVAYMNEESLKATIKEGRTCFWSRSRKELWRKGLTSGHVQIIKNIYYDCDIDALLVLVEQKGAACHTGERTCFYRKLV